MQNSPVRGIHLTCMPSHNPCSDHPFRLQLTSGNRSGLWSCLALAAMIWAAIMMAPCPATAALAAEGDEKLKLQALEYLTWWSHDATGYHPTIGIILQNTTGRDLTGLPIKFQARFLDLRTSYQTRAQKEMRREFRPNQQVPLILHGQRSFELPIDIDAWPSIECKVMCRIGDVSDEGTQDLLVVKLESQTMTDEEARSKLSEGLGFGTRAKAHQPQHTTHEHKRTYEALAATAGSLNPVSSANSRTATKTTALSKFLSSPSTPGLGDDFLAFEQSFGQPLQLDHGEANWTWARFARKDQSLSVIVGSRGRSAKADIVVLLVPPSELEKDTQLVSAARALAGSLKGQQLKGPSNTVRYLPAGRLQLGTLTASGYHGIIVYPRGSAADNNNYVVALSRIPGDIEAMVASHSKRSNMLRFLQPFFTEAE